MSNWMVIQHALENTEDLKQDFGVPEQKKFPLYDRAHVKSAIKFFNYVDPAYEEKLATAIINKINEYGMNDINVGDDNRFKNYYNPEVIEHHGIKGMKWGIRRYQNADGTLTAAGKKRYGSYGEAGLFTHYKKKYESKLKKYIMNKAPDEYNKAVTYAKESLYYNHIAGNIEHGDKFRNDDIRKALGDSYLNAYDDAMRTANKDSKRRDELIDTAVDKAGIDHKGLEKIARNARLVSDEEVVAIRKDANGPNAWGATKAEGYVVNQYVKDNKSTLAQKITDMMVGDLKKWGNANVDNSKIMRQVNKSIDETNISDHSMIDQNSKKGVNIEFMINGIDSYSDGSPMSVIYYPTTGYINMTYV